MLEWKHWSKPIQVILSLPCFLDSSIEDNFKMSSSKKRKYSDEYIKFGFTSIVDKGVEKPQCVVCYKVLGVDSMRPSKMKLHLTSNHPSHVDKDIDYFRRLATGAKSQRLDADGAVHSQNVAAVEASFRVALEIAKNKKPHTIGEELILPCMKIISGLLLGPESVNKVSKVPLSNNTVQRRISKLSDDIEEQVIGELKASGLFALQLDESTDVSSCSQLMVFVRYCHESDAKEEILFCNDLESTTRGADVMEMLDSYFLQHNIEWSRVCGVCTDGAPAMLGVRSGFQALVKQKNTDCKFMHCIIHRQALASKTLPAVLKLMLDAIIKAVNYIKTSALNTRLLKLLCQEMDAEHQNLLYYTSVRWLSKGNVVKRLFSIREQVRVFLQNQKKQELIDGWKDDRKLAYLVDIFSELNTLNLQLQGKGHLVMDMDDTILAFIKKLANWERKIKNGNISMLVELSSVCDSLDGDLKELILEHIRNLSAEFNDYFRIKIDSDSSPIVRMLRNPFTADVTCISDDDDDSQTELLSLQADGGAKVTFEGTSLTKFWFSMKSSYPRLYNIAQREILPFGSTYLCETAFSAMLQIKSKQRNRLNVGDDIRCCLAKTEPRIRKLVDELQHHPSH